MSKNINNRTQAHIVKIEFAPIQEAHVIVRITCRTTRPEATDVSTFVVPGGTSNALSGVHGIQNAISVLREQFPATKIVLDPEAELSPISPLSKWRFDGERELYRARLGLTFPKEFPVNFNDRENLDLQGMEQGDVEWILAHSHPTSPSRTREQADRARHAEEVTMQS